MSQSQTLDNDLLISEEAFKQRLLARHRRGSVGKFIFITSNLVALLVLTLLFLHVLNQAFGYVVVENRVDPATLADQPLEDLNKAELATIMLDNAANRALVVIRDRLSKVAPTEFTTAPLSAVLAGSSYPEDAADLTIRELSPEQLQMVLTANFSESDLQDMITDNIVQPTIIKSWRFLDSMLNRSEIQAQVAADFPDDELQFKSWISLDFITSSVSSSATTAGLRTALLGSFWIVSITSITALVVGVSAAIYLEEYASDNKINRFIEINIRNLAAIPSVIYGMLGLAVFVRSLGDFTSGEFVGVTDSNGRTVVSAGLTLALLILPIIIVNAQEALRAVPSSIREASYGLGATRMQTVFRQVLPAALPGVMTGVILSLSRAIGETAPLLVVGASTFIGVDPNGPFSKFTVVPIQIYQWTSRPEQEFKNVAAAAIIVLLVVMIVLNASAIVIRNRYSRRLS